MIAFPTLDDEYIARPKLTEQKLSFEYFPSPTECFPPQFVYFPSPSEVARNN